jgi:hypothetical protein
VGLEKEEGRIGRVMGRAGWWGKPLGRSFAPLCGYTVAAVRKYLGARVHKFLEMDPSKIIN